MTEAEKAQLRDVFTVREPYLFVVHDAHDDERGTQRFRGPAVDGHPFRARCPNTPASMREPHTIPTTMRVTGEKCGCGKTVTVKDPDHERDRQRLLWQSTRWAECCNKRRARAGGPDERLRQGSSEHVGEPAGVRNHRHRVRS